MKTDQTRVFFKYEENGTIVAVAKSIETDEQLATREVKLRHGDVPNKVVGRAYAFKKLITFLRGGNLITSKERKELWKQFNSTCKQPSQKLSY